MIQNAHRVPVVDLIVRLMPVSFSVEERSRAAGLMVSRQSSAGASSGERAAQCLHQSDEPDWRRKLEAALSQLLRPTRPRPSLCRIELSSCTLYREQVSEISW